MPDLEHFLGSCAEKGAWGLCTAAIEGQKISLLSSPPQTHTVNFFLKHSVDKFYRRLGK